MTPGQGRKYLDATLRELATICARLPAALRQLNQSTGGYPANTSAANTGPPSALSEPYSTTERQAITPRPDPAAHAIAELDQHLPAIYQQARALADLVTLWQPPDQPDGNPTAPIDGEDGLAIWCPNHLAAGHHEPRAHNRTHCRWCDDFNRAHGQLPGKGLLDHRAKHGRVTQKDLERFSQTP